MHKALREYRRVNQKRTIQRKWQHMVHKTEKNETKTLLTQYVLDTTIHKQTNNSTNNNRNKTINKTNNHKN
jgi:hypothetical protein